MKKFVLKSVLWFCYCCCCLCFLCLSHFIQPASGPSGVNGKTIKRTDVGKFLAKNCFFQILDLCICQWSKVGGWVRTGAFWAPIGSVLAFGFYWKCLPLVFDWCGRTASTVCGTHSELAKGNGNLFHYLEKFGLTLFSVFAIVIKMIEILWR